jgi:hypothetical protein
MSKKKQNYSVDDTYHKVFVRGSNGEPFIDDKSYVHLSVTELSYEASIASVRLSVKEAKQVIELLEQGIKDATSKKKVGKK